MPLNHIKETQKKSITVGFLYEVNKERLRLRTLNGEVGFEKEIRDKNIHRPGLALAGYVELYTYDRVQIFGNKEMRYLNTRASKNVCMSLKQFLVLICRVLLSQMTTSLTKN